MKHPRIASSLPLQKVNLYALLLLLIIAGLLLSFFPFKSWVNAQLAGQSLQISPPSQEVTVDPGQTTAVTATLRNASNEPLPIAVRIEDFTATGEEGQVALEAGSPYSVATWTTVTPATFTLGPGEEQEVRAEITVPEDAAGGRYGSIVFSVESEEEGGTAAVSQQIASLFLVRITGPATEAMQLTEFQVPNFSEFGPIPFTMKFNNTGNVHVKTYGLISVTNVLGQKVADIVVPATNVFPGAARNIRASLNQKFLLGPHTATAVMYYGSTENQTLTATASFFVFPTRIALIVLGVLVLLFLLRKRLHKALRALTKG